MDYDRTQQLIGNLNRDSEEAGHAAREMPRWTFSHQLHAGKVQILKGTTDKSP